MNTLAMQIEGVRVVDYGSFGMVAPDEPKTVLVSCLFCESLLKTRAGLEGLADLDRAGWEALPGGDFACKECADERAEMGVVE